LEPDKSELVTKLATIRASCFSIYTKQQIIVFHLYILSRPDNQFVKHATSALSLFKPPNAIHFLDLNLADRRKQTH